jgi:hypothetical protein
VASDHLPLVACFEVPEGGWGEKRAAAHAMKEDFDETP